MVLMSTAKHQPVVPDHRSRLLTGLADAVRESGLAGAQVGDVVRNAGVSRRTFYEVFADKESAIIEFVRDSRTAMFVRLQGAIDVNASWDHQVDQAFDAYFAALERD